MRRLWAALAASLLVLGVAGCSSNDQLADQYLEGSNKGYIAGDGTILEIPAAQRTTPVAFSGTLADGSEFSSSEALGKVLIVNFWYAACAPCRAEAPLLEAVHAGLDPAQVMMVGVNVRDQAETARAFEERFGLAFPSVIDANTGSVQLAFSGTVPANAVPTTIVLDQQGRVAARILGRIAERSILETIVRDLEASPGG